MLKTRNAWDDLGSGSVRFCSVYCKYTPDPDYVPMMSAICVSWLLVVLCILFCKSFTNTLPHHDYVSWDSGAALYMNVDLSERLQWYIIPVSRVHRCHWSCRNPFAIYYFFGSVSYEVSHEDHQCSFFNQLSMQMHSSFLELEVLLYGIDKSLLGQILLYQVLQNLFDSIIQDIAKSLLRVCTVHCMA